MSSASWWHRTLVYLGLKEEPEDAYDEVAAYGDAMPSEDFAVHGSDRRGDVTVRPLRPADEGPPGAEPAPSARAAVVEVDAFEDVESVGARYRTGQPVVLDAGGSDAATARRVLDFVSGMTYVSRGSLTKVGGRAFLLVPDGVRVPEDEQRRLAGLGYRLPSGNGA